VTCGIVYHIMQPVNRAPLGMHFLAIPISCRGTLQQYAGWLHRLHQGKKEVRLYDYVVCAACGGGALASELRNARKATGLCKVSRSVKTPENRPDDGMLYGEGGLNLWGVRRSMC